MKRLDKTCLFQNKIIIFQEYTFIRVHGIMAYSEKMESLVGITFYIHSKMCSLFFFKV